MIEKIANRVNCGLKSDLAKVFSFTALSTSVKMVTALVSTKVVAYIVGPAGVAILGQLTNFVAIILNIASGGISNAITKYIAQYKESDQKVVAILSTAFRLTLWFAIPTSIAMITASSWLSEWVMLSPDFSFVFVIFGLTLIFYALNNLILFAVNGFKLFRLYTYMGISGSLLGLVVTVVLVYTLGLNGALIAAVTYQSVVLLATITLLRKQLWFKIRNFTQKIDKDFRNKFLKYSAAATVFVVSTPLIQMILRGYVMADISETQAGIWEGLNRISVMYMMIVSTSITVYYIPRLSELQDKWAIRYEIIKLYKFLIPLIGVGLVSVYFLRHFIIWILYTPEFEPMQSLFIWQLPLDFVKACSFVISYLLIAKAKMAAYAVTTLLASALYLGLGFLFLKLTGNVVGIIQGEFITQTLYFLTLVVYFRKTLFKRYLTAS